MKRLLNLVVFIILSACFNANAQTRKSVGAAEVRGTFRSYFSGKYKGNYSEIKILAFGKDKLRVAFDLTYPFIDGTGEMSANVGTADGTATIEGTTATFSPDENTQCVITIKFVKSGTIKVKQEGDSECGFGFNVSADGTYRKSSGAKPMFNPKPK